MKFYLISLGCAKNLVDSEKITEDLHKKGYAITGDINEASLVFVNTCGFINEAKKESIETILSVIQEKPVNARIVVFGCLVQRYKKELERSIPEVDLFLPLLSYEKFTDEIRKNFPPVNKMNKGMQIKVAFTLPSYSYVKIAEGCNNFCSYCTIPFIRGHLKSYPIEEIVLEIEKLLGRGFFEINLVAQDLTSYGIDIYGKPSLSVLLRNILSIKKDFWLRLLYLHPSRISKELMEIIASENRLVKYIDMPVQHANSRILNLMKRRYTKEFLLKKITLLRKKIPSVSLRTTLLVGFPTESEEEFNELAEFVQEAGFDHLGVFEYSPEEDTPAFRFKPRVPARLKRKRKRVLMRIQKKLVRIKNKSMTGKVFPCLIEEPADEKGIIWTGRTYKQAPEVDGIVYIKDYIREMGKIVNVRILDFKDYDLIGECVG